jgi:hypothetical protein
MKKIAVVLATAAAVMATPSVAEALPAMDRTVVFGFCDLTAHGSSQLNPGAGSPCR